jgi:hypothetical protein
MKTVQEIFCTNCRQSECQGLAPACNGLYNLDKRRFAVSRNANCFPSEGIIFSFRQSGLVVTGEFHGGAILEGHLLGKFITVDRVEIHLHCLTQSLALLSRTSFGFVCGDPAAKLKLFLDWQWLSGMSGKGSSIYSEL